MKYDFDDAFNFGWKFVNPDFSTSDVKLFLIAFVDAYNDEVVHYKNVFHISSRTKEKARDLAVRKMSEDQFNLYQDGLLKIIIKEM